MGAGPTSPGKAREAGCRLQEALTSALTELVVRQPADPLCWLHNYFQGLLPGSSAAERAVCQLDVNQSGSQHLREAGAAAFLAGNDGQAWDRADVQELLQKLLPLSAVSAGLLTQLQGPEVPGQCSLEEFTAIISAAMLARQTSEAAGAVIENLSKANTSGLEPFPLHKIIEELQDHLRASSAGKTNANAQDEEMAGQSKDVVQGAAENELEKHVFQTISQAV